MKELELGIKKSANVYFPVVAEMLRALQTELSHIGPSLVFVD